MTLMIPIIIPHTKSYLNISSKYLFNTSVIHYKKYAPV